MSHVPGHPPTAFFAIGRVLRGFITGRELAWSVGLVLGAMVANGLFDEWRGPIQVVARLLIVGLPAFFVGRAFWRWWQEQPPAIAWPGAGVALFFALIGWANVVFVTAVNGISESNYALILLAPAAFLSGFLASVGGLLGAGLGVAVTVMGLTHRIPKGGLVVAAGVASVLPNLGHITQVVRILEG